MPTDNEPTVTLLTSNPQIALVKTGLYVDSTLPTGVNAGDTITYTFTLTNTGNTTVNGLTVTDATIGVSNLAVTPATLLPNGTGTATATYTITQADINTGSKTNTATANGLAPNGSPVSDVSDESGTLPTDNEPTITPLCAPNPTTGTVTEPTCTTATGSFAITNYVATNTYTIVPNTGTLNTATGIVTGNAGVSYTITATNSTCTSGASVIININNAPIVPVAPPSILPIQEECFVGQTIFASTAIGLLPTGQSLVWYNEPQAGEIVINPSLNVVGNVSYYAEINNGNCISSTRTKITLILNAIPNAPLVENQTACFSAAQSLTATANAAAGETVNWYATSTSTEIVNPTINAIGTQSFYAEVSNATTCVSTRTKFTLTLNDCEPELIIYNGLTPDGDGLDDVFKIAGIEYYPNNSVEIYNRWGVLVYDIQGYDNQDRSFKGVSEGRTTIKQLDNLPDGTYFYILKYVNSKNVSLDKSGYLYINK